MLPTLAILLAASANLPSALPAPERQPADQEAQDALDEPPPNAVSSISLLWENDGQYFRFFGDTDRWYSNGIKLDVSLRRPWPPFTSKLLPFAGLYDDDAREAGGFVLAQQIYTPVVISAPDPDPDDWPYAGYLYVGTYVQRSDDVNFDHLELDIGIVGEWSGGEAAQKAVHAALPNQIEPAGWDFQLANELAVNLAYQHRWRTGRLSVGSLDLDAILGVGGRLGNVHIDAEANATARLGFNLPDDFGPPTIDSFRDATGTWTGDFGVYAFARLRGQAVARNIFLDGNTFANSRSVDKHVLVGSLQAGVALRYKWFEAGWYSVWMTEQFKGQQGADVFGAWYLGGRFTF